MTDRNATNVQTESSAEMTSSNFTPLPGMFLKKADSSKNLALEAWRRVIHGRKPSNLKPESNAADQSTDHEDTSKKNGVTRRAFMGGVAGVALALLAGKGTAHAASTSSGEVQPVSPREVPTPVNDVHLVTSSEFTPQQPSPDYLKGQQVGYVQARETLEDGSKLWSLDWSLRPIDPQDMVYNLPGRRSFGSFRAAVQHLNLGHPDNGRYKKIVDVDKTITFCNVAASDMADMFQVSHIFSRFDENGTPLLANTMNERIIAEAQRKDQEPEIVLITREEAQQIADMGYPVFLSIKKERRTPNADWINGHIGLVTPGSMRAKKNPEHQKQGIYLTQAGSNSGDVIYFDEREIFTEANGYLNPVFAIDSRDLKDARTKNNAHKTHVGNNEMRQLAQ